MQLDNVSAVVRPRTAWESIDLGFRLVRAHYRTMLLSSALITLPLFVVLHVVLMNHLTVAMLVFWWLKPIWERTHLFIMSRSLFGDCPTAGETLKAFPGYGFRQWLAWLTVYRFSATRSLDMPITMLEGLSGKERNKRNAILRRKDTASAALWLTIVAFHFETFLAFAFPFLGQLLIPDSSDINLIPNPFDPEPGTAATLSFNVLTLAAELLIAPFYVGAGFSLYINRRTVLEGWDIEIAFRRLATRLGERRRHQGIIAVMIVAIAIVATATPTRASSAPIDPRVTAAREAVESVLAGEEFHGVQTIEIPQLVRRSGEGSSWLSWLRDWFERWLNESEPETPTPVWLTSLFSMLGYVIARIFEIGLIVLACALIVYVLYTNRQKIIQLATALAPVPLERRGAPPQVIMGMPVTRESLPDDVIAEVRELWHSGSQRAAFSLLYRATLVELIDHHEVDLHAGYTERDCLRATEQATDAACAGFVRELTHQWQLLAYAHRPPSNQRVEELFATWADRLAAPVSVDPTR